jgi:DNA-binding MarR family transcriptional regulator
MSDATQQLGLFAPRARRSDPISSHDAADELEATGRLRVQQQVVLDAVHRFPGLTSRELAGQAHLDRYMVARRLSELQAGGLITRGPLRVCALGQRRAVTWRIK